MQKQMTYLLLKTETTFQEQSQVIRLIITEEIIDS